MMRSQLTIMYLLFGKHLPDDVNMNMFWCCTYLNAAFVQRRLFCRTHNDVPYYLVHKQRPSVRELIIPGSIMTIINPQKNQGKKLDNSRGQLGFFLGFSNHSSVHLYFDPSKPREFKRSSHCIIEDVATMHTLQSVVVSPFHSIPTKTTPITPQHIVQAYTSTTPISSLSEIQFGKGGNCRDIDVMSFPGN